MAVLANLMGFRSGTSLIQYRHGLGGVLDPLAVGKVLNGFDKVMAHGRR